MIRKNFKSFSSLIPCYLLKAAKFLDSYLTFSILRILSSQTEKNNFVYKPFFVITYFRFHFIFYVKIVNATSQKKVTLLFPLKKVTLLFPLKKVTLNSPSRKREGGAHYVYDAKRKEKWLVGKSSISNLVRSSDLNLKFATLETKGVLKTEQGKIVKLQAFSSSYFQSESHFEGSDTQI